MSGKLRVLHIIGGLQSGGAEALLYRLATRPSSSFNHEVIALGGADWYTPLLQRHGVRVHHLNIRSAASAPAGLIRLNRLIGASGADVIQSWMYNSNLLAGVMTKPRRIPVVWGIHSSTLAGLGLATRSSARLGGLLHKWLAQGMINCSSRSAELHSRLGYSEASTAVIHNGYDPETFVPDERRRQEMRRELGLEPGTFVIGTIARWNRRKDVPNLLRAVAELSARQRPFKCVLIGRGLDQANERLHDLVAASGGDHAILRLGERTDLPNLARAMDVHVLPSATEAFPGVVAETMLAGVPNVVTDVGDAALLVGDAGWVVPSADSQRLADAIEAAFLERNHRPDCWAERKSASRARIEERFTFERMAQRYEEVWREAIEARRARA